MQGVYKGSRTHLAVDGAAGDGALLRGAQLGVVAVLASVLLLDLHDAGTRHAPRGGVGLAVIALGVAGGVGDVGEDAVHGAVGARALAGLGELRALRAAVEDTLGHVACARGVAAGAARLVAIAPLAPLANLQRGK